MAPDDDPRSPVAPVRLDWRDLVRNAADLALLGIVATLAAVPVVTAPAAVATASAAVRFWIEHGHWPGVRPALRGFARALLPGLGALLVVAVVAGLLGLNLLALLNGVVPGGTPAAVLTGALAALGAGLGGLIVVQIGGQSSRGWRAAARTAGRRAAERPLALLAVTGVLALAAVLCTLILPLLTPIFLGYLLFALHAVTRRLDPPLPARASPGHGAVSRRTRRIHNG
ncbi:hypothetical protein O7627_02440 [Solwaraspora sp. WMMD1047]|uniref:hypothetical protein n=1 Tax=Solwaraspora sp. WMMD1047 TaxID=3016102 RepID=UPI002415A533|nr:hypothetical protein [Solwaraspora sp. WMMD1047]MDG4828163.1 hypothetical protein [Solwaraspora sp. WMMD1047]